MPNRAKLSALIANASETLAPYWPLRSFIAVNPLQGLEHLPFEQAVAEGAARFGGRGYPSDRLAGEALADGRIDRASWRRSQATWAGRSWPTGPPARRRRARAPAHGAVAGRPRADQGAGRLPGRRAGGLADAGPASGLFPGLAADRPARPGAAGPGVRPRAARRPGGRAAAAAGRRAGRRRIEDRLTAHLLALPGWSSYVKWRADNPVPGAPIALADLLAVRLTLCHLFADASRPSCRRRRRTACPTAGSGSKPGRRATAGT